MPITVPASKKRSHLAEGEKKLLHNVRGLDTPMLTIDWSPDFDKGEPEVKCALCRADLDCDKKSWYTWLFFPTSKAETLPGKRFEYDVGEDEWYKEDPDYIDWVSFPLCGECICPFQDDVEGENQIYIRHKGTLYLHEVHDCIKMD